MTTEQTESVETPVEGVGSGDRDQLIAAATAAADAEQAADAPAVPVKATKAAPKDDDEEIEAKPADEEAPPVEEERPISAVAKAIREAKEKQQQRLAERSQIEEQYLSKLDADRRAIAEKEAAFAQKEREIAAKEERFMAAQRDISKYGEFSGKTPQEIAQELMIQGSPEHQAMVRDRAKVETLEARLAARERADQEREQREAAQRAHYQQQQRQQVERQFNELTGNAEKYPLVARLPEYLRVAWGDKIADEYSEATNKVAPFDLIAEYMETSLSGQADAAESSPKQKPVNGKAPTSRANGPRTLSNSVASERRASPKAISPDMSPEELRKALVAVAKETEMTST